MSIMLVLTGLAGGGLYTNVDVNLTHCTFARNLCGAEDGGGVYHAAGGSAIKNSILWLNSTDAGSPPNAEADQIKVAGGTVTATWTCVQHIDTLDGATNTGDNPLFKNATSDDYELDPVDCGFETCSSSGIDFSGDGDCPVGCIELDVRRLDRTINLDNRSGQVLDKGALETQSSS